MPNSRDRPSLSPVLAGAELAEKRLHGQVPGTAAVVNDQL
jgi:hypothetical protein